MSTAPPPPPPGQDPPTGGSAPGYPSGAAGGTGSGGSRPPSGTDRLFAWLRGLGLRRDTSDKWLAGVCSGIAQRLGVDPIVIRAVALALFLFGGLGFFLYVLSWAFLPTRDGLIRAEEALHGDPGGIVLLVLIGLSLLGELTDRSHSWWLVIPVGIAVWFIARGRRRGQSMQEIGADARARAHGFARTVQGWSSCPGHSGDPAKDAASGTGSAASPGSAASHGAATGSGASGSGMPPGPHGMGPGRTWSGAAAPSTRVVTVRERRRRIGFLGVIVLLGLALLAFGIAASAEVSPRPVAFGLACAVGVLGLGLFVAGLLGRRAGGLATLGLAAALATGIAVSAPPTLSWDAMSKGAGEPTWRPAEAAASSSYELGAGSALLDLGALSADGADDQPISATVSLGELTIVVPQGVTVRVDANVAAGEIITKTGSPSGSTSEDNSGKDLHESVVVGSGTPDAVVTANVGLGTLTIVKP